MAQPFTPPPGQEAPTAETNEPKPDSTEPETKGRDWWFMIPITFLLLFVGSMAFMFWGGHNEQEYSNWRGAYPLTESTEVRWTYDNLHPVGQTETCSIYQHSQDGRVSVVRVGEEHLLVRYETPRGPEELHDDECPNDTQAVVRTQTYNRWVDSMEQLWESLAANQEAERARLAEECELRRAEQQLTR